MFKRLLILVILSAVICHLSPVAALAQHVYLGMYWIAGSVSDPDGKGTEGRQVVFYKDDPFLAYSDDKVGTVGLAGVANKYIISAFKDPRFSYAPLTLTPGKYHVGIVKGTDNYGANPVEVNVTGKGYDIAPNLVLAYGAGLSPLPPPGYEPAPEIKVWFGNRLYQPSIYGTKEEGKQQFVVQETGQLKIEVNIRDPFLLDESKSYAMTVRTPAGEVRTFDLSRATGFNASATGVKPFVIQANYPVELKALEDENLYTLTFNAASKGTLGLTSTATSAAAVTTLGGALRLIGTPIVYPSPVHLKTDRECFFQYTLSRNANIDIFVFDVSARVVKKISCNAGKEGGLAGLNKVRWNLITDQGSLIASGIEVFTIVDPDSGKLLGRGKFTALP